MKNLIDTSPLKKANVKPGDLILYNMHNRSIDEQYFELCIVIKTAEDSYFLFHLDTGDVYNKIGNHRCKILVHFKDCTR